MDAVTHPEDEARRHKEEFNIGRACPLKVDSEMVSIETTHSAEPGCT